MSHIAFVESSVLSSPQKTESEPSKFKTLGFAVLIIFGIGSLAVAGAGVGGLLQAGSLTNLGQLNSIIMIVIGGAGGIPLLVIGILGFIDTCSSFNSKAHDKTAILVQTQEIEARKRANEPLPLTHIDEMKVIKLERMEYKGVTLRVMMISVFLDKILSLDESEYIEYVTTLITCLEMLQRFDKNLVFGVVFTFRKKDISLVGEEKRCLAFAETMFTHFVGKYIGGQMQKDGSQKLNLLNVFYLYPPFKKIVKHWIDKAKPLISVDTIVAHSSAENSEEAEKKLDRLRKITDSPIG